MNSISEIRARYGLGEEIANSILHGIGAGLSVAALVIMIVRSVHVGNGWMLGASIVYGVSLLFLYLASTLYHSLTPPRAKELFRVLDHVGIFVLIAGTYTPFLLVNLRTGSGWSLFIVIWSLALAGVIGRLVWRERFHRIELLMYLLMGWVCIGVFRELYDSLSATGATMLIVGGVAYTLGVPFYMWESKRYTHAVWHGFVLAGSIFHFFAVMTGVLVA